MSYDIHLFSIQTRQQQQLSKNPAFFDQPDNLVAFSSTERQALQQRLLAYNYQPIQTSQYGQHFAYPGHGTALLTARGLYFSTHWNQDSIFEVGMTASEFCDNGEFAKYDPQNNGWEEI